MKTDVADPFVQLQASNGVEIHLHSTDKYKTVLLQWNVIATLDEGLSARALLGDLLTRATRRQPDLSALNARCDELYATELLGHVSAAGPYQLLGLGLETVADRHVGGRPVLDEAAELLREALQDPPLEAGLFREDHFEQERANMIRAIEGLADDKATHAYLKLLELLHGGTPFGRHSWGTLAGARALDRKAVTEAWADVRDRLPVRLFLVGDVDESRALALAERLGGEGPRDRPPVVVPPPPILARDPTHGTERQPLAQSKLAMGFRVAPELLPGAAAPLFGMAFGGGSHARLFKRVREAESLAYGCGASLQVESGTLVVQAGIDAPVAARVQELVLEELRRLADEGLDEEELALSRRAQMRRLENLRDSPRGWCRFRHAALLAGRPYRLEESLERVASVTPDQIAEVASAATLDAVFLLEGTQTS